MFRGGGHQPATPERFSAALQRHSRACWHHLRGTWDGERGNEKAALDVPDLILPFVIAGTGLGFFFAPITRLTLSYAPGQFEGIASGTSNALRQVGTVLGIAVLGSVFSAAGGLGSAGLFITGLTAALTVSAVILGASALVILLAPETRPARQAVGAGAGVGLAVPGPRRGVTDLPA